MPSPRRLARLLPLVALVVASRAAAVPLPGGTYRILPDQSRVGFTALKWSMFEIEGLFRTHRGAIVFDPAAPERSRVSWEVDVASIATGSDDRDRALRAESFLDAAHHPRMRFESTSVRRAADGALEVEGTLTIRGVTRPLRSTVRLLGGREVPGEGFLAGFATEFTIDRRDYGVLGGSLSRQMIGNDVRIHLSAGAVRER